MEFKSEITLSDVEKLFNIHTWCLTISEKNQFIFKMDEDIVITIPRPNLL